MTIHLGKDRSAPGETWANAETWASAETGNSASAPPKAPMAMPRQVLERPRRSLIAYLARALPAALRASLPQSRKT